MVKSRRARVRATVKRAVETKEGEVDKIVSNPFERRDNARQKHQVLGRRVQGSERNVALARAKAAEKRDATLLQEYKNEGRTGVFIDRRFGEGDAALDEETKMMARFKKERVRQAKASKKFDIHRDDSATLTHFGRAVDDLPADRDMHFDSDSDDGPSIFDALKFGGGDGEEPRRTGSRGKTLLPAWMQKNENGEVRKKTHKEIMEEVVMKSKAAKYEKQQERHDQEERIESLDNEIDAIRDLLDFRKVKPTKKDGADKKSKSGEDDKKAKPDLPPQDAVADDYDDILAKVAAASRKARASDRTKTVEEAAKEELEKLQELEALRIQRMQVTQTAASDAAAIIAPTGDELAENYALPKKPWEIDLSSEEEESDDDGAPLDDGSVDDDDDDDDDDDEDDDDDDGSDSEDRGSDMDSDKFSGDDDDDEDGETKEEKNEKKRLAELMSERERAREKAKAMGIKLPESLRKLPAKARLALKKRLREAGLLVAISAPVAPTQPKRKDKPARADDDDVDEHRTKRARAESKSNKAAGRGDSGEAGEAGEEEEKDTTGIDGVMPFIIACPTTSGALARSLETYCSTAADVDEMMTRIRACSSIHVSAENRLKLQGLLKSVLALVGSKKELSQLSPAYIDAFIPHVHALTKELHFEAVRVWQEVVSLIHRRVNRAIRTGVSGGGGGGGGGGGDDKDDVSEDSAWPTVGELMVTEIAISIFPTTDFRHAVLTPLSVFLAQCLAQCPVRSWADLGRGVLVCGQLLELTLPAKRLVPEVLSFLHGLFSMASQSKKLRATPASIIPSLLRPIPGAHRSFEFAVPEFARRVRKWKPKTDSEKETGIPARIRLSDLGAGTRPKSAHYVALLLAAAQAVELVVTHLSSNEGLPEALEALCAAMCATKTADFAPQVKVEFEKTANMLVDCARSTAATRLPVTFQKEARKPVAIQSLAPMIDEHYVATGVTGDDAERQREETRKLKRAINREKRGVARELKRDSAYIAEVRDKERAERDAEREAKTREVMSFLQQQQATFNETVKIGLSRGGGTASAIGARKRRR